MKDIHIRLRPDEEEFLTAMEISPSKIFHEAVFRESARIQGLVELGIEHEEFDRWAFMDGWIEWWIQNTEG